MVEQQNQQQQLMDNEGINPIGSAQQQINGTRLTKLFALNPRLGGTSSRETHMMFTVAVCEVAQS